MPPMEYFPKSHIVTFKYYVGVILFLDENYHEVALFPLHMLYLRTNSVLSFRQRHI